MKGTLIIGAVLFGIVFLRACVFYDRCENARNQYDLYEGRRKQAVAELDFDTVKRMGESADYWYGKVAEHCQNK